MIIDSHCHLDYPNLYERLDDVVERGETNQVKILLKLSKKHWSLMAELVKALEYNHDDFIQSSTSQKIYCLYLWLAIFNSSRASLKNPDISVYQPTH